MPDTAQHPVWGVSTKGLRGDDGFARQISHDFVDLVDPRMLIMFLPPHLLTFADEDRVTTKQNTNGREEAAWLLLSLLCQRGDWIPSLQEALRHPQIRLGHLADKIDAQQCEVAMEIDFADNAAIDLMETDAEPWSSGPSSESTSEGPLFQEQSALGTFTLTSCPSLLPPVTEFSVLSHAQAQGQAQSSQSAFTQAPSPPDSSHLLQAQAQAQFSQSAFSQALSSPGTSHLLQGQAQAQAQAQFSQAAFSQAPEPALSASPPHPQGSGMTGDRATNRATSHTVDKQAFLTELARHFFLNLAKSPEDVAELALQLERIASVLASEYAVGCLELRLRVATSRDLLELRRLVESGVLQETVQQAVLSKERRDWLNQEAASYGLTWRQIRLKVTIRKEDLDRCETFLRAKEEIPNPRNAAEALLRKVSKTNTERKTTWADTIQTLPDLLVAFLGWLLGVYPKLAEKVATILATSSLDIGLTESMATCRQHFGLSSEFENELASIASEVLQKASEDATVSASASPESQDLTKCPSVSIQAEPGSRFAGIVERLCDAMLMVPCDIANKEHVYVFINEFVADFALSCIVCTTESLPRDFISKTFQIGSRFAILHILDLLLNLCLPMEHFESGLRAHPPFGGMHLKQSTYIDRIQMGLAHQLLQTVSDNIYPQDVLEMYLTYYIYIRFPDCRPLFKRFWWVFGRQWKLQIQEMSRSDSPDALPDINVCTMTIREMDDVTETAEQILSAKQSVDLTEKLTNLTKSQLRVILACVQLTNVTNFQLVKAGAVMKVSVRHDMGTAATLISGVGQPALKLCKNDLKDMHVECLLDALPGMESVSCFDFSSCTITQDNLQRVLNHLPAVSVNTLVLNRICFTGSDVSILPRFSHLKKIQRVELGFLGLGDNHMPFLTEQLRELADLRELTLDNNPITTAGLSQLAACLASCTSLRILRLAGCQLDAGAAYVLGAILTASVNLHVLHLSQCQLLDSGLQHLSLVLKNHTLLTKVSLRDGKYTPHGLASFFTHLAKCQRMQHLELGRCPLEEDGCDVSDRFLQALSKSQQWNYLGLWQCRIGHCNFLENLSKLPNQLRGLTSLILQENDINDAQVDHLASAVQGGVFRHLKRLNLCSNHIREKGAKRLAEVLPLLPNMSELLMQHLTITVDGAVSLARSVLRLPDMKLLDISDSDGMNHYEVIEAVNEIERVLLNEVIVVGVGVGYPENDKSLEQKYVDERLQLLKPSKGTDLGTEDVAMETEPLFHIPECRESESANDTVKMLEDYEMVGPESYDEAAGAMPQAGAEVHGDQVSLAPLSPKPEEIPDTRPEVHRRQITRRDMQGLTIDGTMRICVGHN